MSELQAYVDFRRSVLDECLELIKKRRQSAIEMGMREIDAGGDAGRYRRMKDAMSELHKEVASLKR